MPLVSEKCICGKTNYGKPWNSIQKSGNYLKA